LRGRARNKKGQAAIEFLTTYSWALLGIIISIGALSYFDLLNSDRYVGESCNTGSQIQCLELQVEPMNTKFGKSYGVLKIGLRNNYPVDVDIELLTITINGKTYDNKPAYENTPYLPRGREIIVQGPLLQDFDARTGEKLDVGIEISFSRVGGSNDYTIKGSAVAKVKEALCGDTNVDAGEQCEPPDIQNGMTPKCSDFGFRNVNDLKFCTQACTFDYFTSGCT
jgi:hypothetical protein